LTIPLRQAGRRHEALLAQHESVWSHVNQSPIPYRTASGQALAIALVENMSDGAREHVMQHILLNRAAQPRDDSHLFERAIERLKV